MQKRDVNKGVIINEEFQEEEVLPAAQVREDRSKAPQNVAIKQVDWLRHGAATGCPNASMPAITGGAKPEDQTVRRVSRDSERHSQIPKRAKISLRRSTRGYRDGWQSQLREQVRILQRGSWMSR